MGYNTYFTRVMRDERGFVHKKLLGIGKRLVGAAIPSLTSFIPGASIVQRGLGLIGGIASRVRQFPIRTRGGQVLPAGPLTVSTPRATPPRTQTARVTPMSQAQKQLALSTKFPEISDIIGGIGGALRERGNGGPSGSLVCDPPLVPNERGTFCSFPGSPEGGVGEARMGRFGAALEPGFMTINKRECLPGMVLGKDFLCYNKGSISNKQRLWPKGTAPLLTGGEMAAIRKADSARGKVARTAKRLGIGTPTRRRARPHAHAKALRAVSIPS